jgi:hypothetical protein
MKTLLKWLSPAALVLGAGLLAGPAAAAPLGNVGALETANDSVVDSVHYRHRRCWRHRGHWHCRRGFRRYVYSAPYYYEPYPYYSYGPVIGFSFGGGRHFHHRRFHGRHFHGRHFHGGRRHR